MSELCTINGMAAGTPVSTHVLKQARSDAGLSQAELAKRAGISTGFIAMIELGQRHPSVKVLQSLARELDLPVSRLLKTEEAISTA